MDLSEIPNGSIYNFSVFADRLVFDLVRTCLVEIIVTRTIGLVQPNRFAFQPPSKAVGCDA